MWWINAGPTPGRAEAADKAEAPPIARALADLGFTLYATRATHAVLAGLRYAVPTVTNLQAAKALPAALAALKAGEMGVVKLQDLATK